MRKRVALVVALVVCVGAAALVWWSQDDYRLRVVMPTADGAFEGATVSLRGGDVGTVEAVHVREGRAEITVSVDEANAPLPSGTTARISWNSVLGSRGVELLPGKEGNPPLADGQMITSDIERVEVDDVLAALDKPTRKRLQSLLGQLDGTLEGRERDVKQTLTTAGPAVKALGEVLRGLGQDGPAIRKLVTKLREMIETLANRDDELALTVRDLHQTVGSVAGEQRQLKQALDELPPTLRQGRSMFGKIPRAVDETVPLLRELRPATRKLPQVASNLSPVLAELRPTVATLKPTLRSASALLRHTPGLLDSAHQTLPDVTRAVTSAQPAVTFLRPYTPEVIGFLSNWTSLFAGKNPSGHFGRALIVESATSVNNNPGILPPGMQQDPRPAPGSLAGQPWTDANGDGIR